MDWKQKIWQASQYIMYKIKAKHYGGHGIHSPFVYSFVKDILEEKKPYYCYQEIEKRRLELKNSSNTVFVEDFGTGKSSEKKISTIAHNSLKDKKYAQLLFRMVNHFKPNTIIELGTCLGITTSYLAAANTKAAVFTLEGSKQLADIAQNHFNKMNLNNIQSIIGNIDNTLNTTINNIHTLDFVYFDANHKKTPTLNYFNECLSKTNNNTIFIFDDIYWSKEMKEAWNEIYRNKKVTISIDLFSIGIVFFNQELKKEHYRIQY